MFTPADPTWSETVSRTEGSSLFKFAGDSSIGLGGSFKPYYLCRKLKSLPIVVNLGSIIVLGLVLSFAISSDWQIFYWCPQLQLLVQDSVKSCLITSSVAEISTLTSNTGVFITRMLDFLGLIFNAICSLLSSP